MDTPQTRPFHETIVDMLGKASPGQAIYLFDLIVETTIPANHDAIIAAIDKCFDFQGGEKYARAVKLVKGTVVAQKQNCGVKKCRTGQ